MAIKKRGLEGIDRIMDSLYRHANKEISEATLRIYADVTANPATGTPLDTGNANANWILSKNTPDHREPKPPKSKVARPKGDGRPYVDPFPDAAEREQEIREFDLRNGDSVTYLQNNAPYIGPLNDGHSPQSPAGWVDRAMDRSIDKMNRGLK